MVHSLRRPFPKKLAGLLMAACLVIGLYFPTSHHEDISKELELLAYGPLLVLLVGMLFRKWGVLGASSVANSAAILVIVLATTIFSPFTEFAYGGFVPIFALSLLLCVNLKDIPLTALPRHLFTVINLLNIVLGILIILETPWVGQFLMAHYSFGYPELVPYMLGEAKPVLTFGSHSLAGFFLYLFFYLTFQTFAVTGSKIHLAYAVGNVMLLTYLNSFTATIFAVFAAIQLIVHFQWHRSILAGVLATLLLVASIGIVATRLDAVDSVASDLLDLLHREDNGLLGRYSAYGGLLGNLQYIADHPFSPIGLGLSRRLWYADSGPVEYMMKGSVPLVLCVYGGIFFFFRRNLVSKRRALFLFLVFLSFEIGYSNLQYIRTQYFLPFLVVYLNALDQRDSTPASRWSHA